MTWMWQRWSSSLWRATFLGAIAVAGLHTSPWRVSAQSPVAQGMASVRGTVRSQGGRPVSGARLVTADSAHRTTTDSLGRFTFAVPSSSALTLAISAVGYRPSTIAVSRLVAGETRALSVTLAPLYVLDPLTVVANPERPLLNTENASTGGALERAELSALPTDARDPIALLFHVAGVTQATGFFGDAPVLSFNGQNSLYTSYLLDGLDNTEGFLGGPRVEFPLSGLARIDALVNTYSTSYGRSPSGIVNQYTRAGGNRTHGELFAYSRPGTRLGLDGDNPVPSAHSRPQSSENKRASGGISLAVP